jgi:hypothetical protein
MYFALAPWAVWQHIALIPLVVMLPKEPRQVKQQVLFALSSVTNINALALAPWAVWLCITFILFVVVLPKEPRQVNQEVLFTQSKCYLHVCNCLGPLGSMATANIDSICGYAAQGAKTSKAIDAVYIIYSH